VTFEPAKIREGSTVHCFITWKTTPVTCLDKEIFLADDYRSPLQHDENDENDERVSVHG
jgi:hypothetical protein